MLEAAHQQVTQANNSLSDMHKKLVSIAETLKTSDDSKEPLAVECPVNSKILSCVFAVCRSVHWRVLCMCILCYCYRTFPACRFGDACLFIHPNCKFDASCRNARCPYTHSCPRRLTAASAAVPVIVQPVRGMCCVSLQSRRNW